MKDTEDPRPRCHAGRGAALAAVPARPTNVAEALRALETVTARLMAQGDPKAAFPDIYAIITRRVKEEIERPSSAFLEPGWISRLAGCFCERYLRTLRAERDGEDQPGGAWRSAYAAAGGHALPPVQHALLGLSAHINFDLAGGIHATIVELGRAGDARMLARYKHDHDRVNRILFAAIPEALDALADRHGCPVSGWTRARAAWATRWVMLRVLVRWRARVWEDVRGLLGATSERARARVLRAVERRSAMYGRALARPFFAIGAEMGRAA
jgi:Family of unknown function (DUF5995)